MSNKDEFQLSPRAWKWTITPLAVFGVISCFFMVYKLPQEALDSSIACFGMGLVVALAIMAWSEK